MAEFIQNYGIWILLVGGMFLMHRLGIGCCGGHRRAHGEGRKPEPRPVDANATAGEKPGALAATSPRRGTYH